MNYNEKIIGYDARKMCPELNTLWDDKRRNEYLIRKDAKRIFPKELWNDLHLQIIWYGREYSKRSQRPQSCNCFY